ncbi:hypothetical protein GCM10009809_25870 [Isoptericola hypogeus]|uniref:Uncharacterized protein n=1 Tax=Isoptericola hypogeus TaxID=300179 RepID=A0ABN2JJE2_9MICO
MLAARLDDFAVDRVRRPRRATPGREDRFNECAASHDGEVCSYCVEGVIEFAGSSQMGGAR